MPAYIAALGTSVPDLALPQSQIADFTARLLGMDEPASQRLKALYRATGIRQRHTVVRDFARQQADFTFFSPNDPSQPPSTAERMSLYAQSVEPLAEQAASNCLTHFAAKQVTHLITVSCTGMGAPGWDIGLIRRLGLPLSTARTAINFMGCYGAFIGLKTAQAICLADPKAKALVVCAELCSLHLQHSLGEDQLLSGALFADGASAALVTATQDQAMARLGAFEQGLILEGASEMAWAIGNQGFEMVLSGYVPDLLGGGIRAFLSQMLPEMATKAGLPAGLGLAIHPGGRRILQELEKAIGISAEENQVAYQILRNFGNMSSATFLFVLQEALANNHQADRLLGMAFGPGLTVESGLFYRL